MNFTFKIHNFNNLCAERYAFIRLILLFRSSIDVQVHIPHCTYQCSMLMVLSKKITDLLLPQTSLWLHTKSFKEVVKSYMIFIRLSSRSLNEINQMNYSKNKERSCTTKILIESRKSYQSVNPRYVWI